MFYRKARFYEERYRLASKNPLAHNESGDTGCSITLSARENLLIFWLVAVSSEQKGIECP